MAQTTEGASETVEAVRFSFMTDEEVRRHSVLKITNPVLLDSVGRPVPGGLYDPALGPIDEHTPCRLCGQQSFHCPGHCGHIDLVSTVYNPLLFSMLHNLLQRTCFNCLHFRAERSLIDKCTSQLEMIACGDVAGAKDLDTASASESIYSEDSDGDHVSSSTVYSGAQYGDSKHQKQQPWTSLQFSEAMSVLDTLLKVKSGKCARCGAKNPKISKPTFGWFHVLTSNAQASANAIKGFKFEGVEDGGEDKTSSEVINVNDHTSEDGLGTAETNSRPATSARRKKRAQDGAQAATSNKMGKKFFSGPLLPSEVRNIMKHLWENEACVCSYLCDIQRQKFNTSANRAGYSMFFLEAVLVPPTKFRPAAKAGDAVMEHPQTVLLGKVLQSNIALGNAHTNNSERSKIVNRWMDLQQSINVLFDSKTAVGQGLRDANSGICQLLEKKEGIFRQKMMGKRVNFACRSVISPDPYLAVNEIGVPPYFALRLTYPERVTPWNVVKLRDAIVNGPESHPGATHYTDRVSTVRLPQSKKMRVSISRKLPSSRGMVIQSRESRDYEFEGKVVYRHLQDGDIVLVNRQPTLHKPSIMAHVVRVLKGEKTLRMHYANCSSYNADFDGDEMNVHFPQDEVSRAEAYNIANANNQYIVPTRGDTVRGLIQDHIVSAVLLTMKDTFLNRDEYNQLLYVSGVFTETTASHSGKCSRKVSVVDREGFMQLPLPAVWKPKPLWTGKQVITAVLNHLTRGYTPCIVDNKVRIPHQYFASATQKYQERGVKEDKSKNQKDKQNAADETKFLIWKNELVLGVIDKAQFGKYGLVHTVQELYGSNTAGLLLSALSRLFTAFLQIQGFTCGLDDLIVAPDCDANMKKELEGEDVGKKVHCKFVNLDNDKIDPEKLQLETEKAIHSNGQVAIAHLDNLMQAELKDKGSMISKKWLPDGLLKPFPSNCISLMTISGAKGSSVNFQQISFLLGQQELEGKRVPRMVSGKTLPSFPPWDYTSRAGGYITDRFLTGLRPQEYYFHCMAGREGLVDTAVKTSRSGYLQRCLIKNLECLKVCYDYTVRDADGSIVQFFYGEDGVDVHQTSFLNNLEALKANRDIICQKSHQQLEFNTYIQELPEGIVNKVNNHINEISKRGQASSKVKQKDLLMLLRQKYLSSLAQSGEPVGVIAAQSVGEPSTQMTLNTFHLAGRGEMNVTLGIPRLQEILMTAAAEIKTPIVTCPLNEGKSRKDAEALVENLKRLTVAELMESIEVRLLPLSIHNNEICRIYKLMVKLKEPNHVSLRDCQDTLEFTFLRQLEDTIESHLVLLSKISGIKNFTSDSRPVSSKETDEDGASTSKSQGEENDDEDGDEDEDERIEDLGSEYHKRKQQASDAMDYEDGSDEEQEPSAEHGKEGGDDDEVEDGDLNVDMDNQADTEIPETQHEHGAPSKPKSSDGKAISKPKGKKKAKAVFHRKDSDRAIFVEVKGLTLEVHFKFTNEPEMLLAQVVEKAAKKVYIKGSGKLDQCNMVQYNVNERQVRWNEEDPKIKKFKDKKKNPENNKKDDDSLPWALTAAGMEFGAFWEIVDELDLRHVYSNNIHVMLNTYGVEAARKSIILEIKNVFQNYGVEIDYRHLSLIADYMTHTGGYNPMSRHGSIAGSISPFLKMSFETASKFIVEAASHGLTDNLETPSSRICLGLPAKVGTGSFDLMQKLDI